MSNTFFIGDPAQDDADPIAVGRQSAGWRFMHCGGTGVTTRAEWEAWINSAADQGMTVFSHSEGAITASEFIARTSGRAEGRSAVQVYHSDPAKDAEQGIQPGDYWQDADGHDFSRRF